MTQKNYTFISKKVHYFLMTTAINGQIYLPFETELCVQETVADS